MPTEMALHPENAAETPPTSHGLVSSLGCEDLFGGYCLAFWGIIGNHEKHTLQANPQEKAEQGLSTVMDLKSLIWD